VITTIYYYLLFQLPKTSQEWLTIAKGFEELWNFPHCLGALDGKHIVIQSPFNSGSEYYNYKTSFSVVLMAAVDANYCFIYAEVGCQGRISDGGVFKHTVLYDKLEREHLEIPLDAPLITLCNKGFVYVYFSVLEVVGHAFKRSYDICFALLSKVCIFFKFEFLDYWVIIFMRK
jgi:hypothetical protein